MSTRDAYLRKRIHVACVVCAPIPLVVAFVLPEHTLGGALAGLLFLSSFALLMVGVVGLSALSDPGPRRRKRNKKRRRSGPQIVEPTGAHLYGLMGHGGSGGGDCGGADGGGDCT